MLEELPVDSSGRARLGRRAFTRSLLGVPCAGAFRVQETVQAKRSRVALVKHGDRKVALDRALALFGTVDLAGRSVLLKGSFNSADEFPATTHPEMLADVIAYLRQAGATRITLVERSGMGRTRDVWAALGIPDRAGRLGVELVALDELETARWRREPLEGSHWSRGVEVPDLLQPEAAVVQIANLKTHRFGGFFSGSLKNTVGLLAKTSREGHNYMAELHGSADQRLMIAEANQVYLPALVVMDARQVFVDGGPEAGDLASPDTVVVGSDRVAIDAVGVALLRLHGAGPPLGRGAVFEQDQLRRAAELGLGVGSGKEIELQADDPESRRLASQVTAALEREPPAKKPQ